MKEWVQIGYHDAERYAKDARLFLASIRFVPKKMIVQSWRGASGRKSDPDWKAYLKQTRQRRDRTR